MLVHWTATTDGSNYCNGLILDRGSPKIDYVTCADCFNLFIESRRNDATDSEEKGQEND